MKRFVVHVGRVSAGSALVAALAWVIASGATGCSSSSPAAPVVEASVYCPESIDAAVGAACSSEGLVCSPTFACGFVTVTIYCKCSEGTFQCLDGDGGTLSAGQEPSCGSPASNPTSCPPTEGAAAVATCPAADNGQECAYLPKCEGGTAAFDRCTCGANPNGGGFVYTCQNGCNTGSPPSDGGSAVTDGSATDALPTPDAGGD